MKIINQTITVYQLPEPCSMTLAEWRKLAKKESASNAITDRWHRESVEHALFEKRRVAKKVLADYPKIKPKNHIIEIDN